MPNYKGKDLDDVPAQRGQRRSIPSDRIEVHKFKNKAWTIIRLFGPVFCTAQYWVQAKKRDGGNTRFPVVCPSFDYETQTRDPEKYDPWRDYADKVNVYDNDNPKNNKIVIQYGRDAWMNAIVRTEQKNAPRHPEKPTKKERSTHFKDKDSDSYTPMKAVRLTKSLLEKIQNLKGVNTYEMKSGQTKSFPVSHPKYGRDIKVFYDKDAQPANQYQVQLGDKRKPLTEEEQECLIQDLSLLADEVPSREQIERDFYDWAKRNNMEIDMPGKKKAKQDEELKHKKKKHVEEDDDDFDDDDEGFDDDDDDDEDEAPKPKKGKKAKKVAKKSSKKSKKSKDEDEDEEDDDDFDDDDEDEDDSDEDEDDDDFDDDDDDSEDDDDDEDSEDEDDDEDDDEDSEDDDDEDEDEAPKRKVKKGAKKAVKKPAKKAVKAKKEVKGKKSKKRK